MNMPMLKAEAATAIPVLSAAADVVRLPMRKPELFQGAHLAARCRRSPPAFCRRW